MARIPINKRRALAGGLTLAFLFGGSAACSSMEEAPSVAADDAAAPHADAEALKQSILGAIAALEVPAEP